MNVDELRELRRLLAPTLELRDNKSAGLRTCAYVWCLRSCVIVFLFGLEALEQAVESESSFRRSFYKVNVLAMALVGLVLLLIVWLLRNDDDDDKWGGGKLVAAAGW